MFTMPNRQGQQEMSLGQLSNSFLTDQSFNQMSKPNTENGTGKHHRVSRACDFCRLKKAKVEDDNSSAIASHKADNTKVRQLPPVCNLRATWHPLHPSKWPETSTKASVWSSHPALISRKHFAYFVQRIPWHAYQSCPCSLSSLQGQLRHDRG